MIRNLNNAEHKRLDIVSTFLGAHALPEEYAERSDEYVGFLIRKVSPLIHLGKRAKYYDVFCEQGVFSIEQSRRLLQTAKEHDFLLRFHADEIVSLGGVELAVELGALSASHLLHVSDASIRAVTDTGVVATLLPLTAFALREPYARDREMIDADCAVTLTVNPDPGGCFSGSIPLIIALARIYAQMSIGETVAVPTLNGAAALRRTDRIGSIEVGRQDDFVILNSDSYRILPYYIDMNCVIMTVRGGVLYPVA